MSFSEGTPIGIEPILPPSEEVKRAPEGYAFCALTHSRDIGVVPLLLRELTAEQLRETPVVQLKLHPIFAPLVRESSPSVATHHEADDFAASQLMDTLRLCGLRPQTVFPYAHIPYDGYRQIGQELVTMYTHGNRVLPPGIHTQEDLTDIARGRKKAEWDDITETQSVVRVGFFAGPEGLQEAQDWKLYFDPDDECRIIPDDKGFWIFHTDHFEELSRTQHPEPEDSAVEAKHERIEAREGYFFFPLTHNHRDDARLVAFRYVDEPQLETRAFIELPLTPEIEAVRWGKSSAEQRMQAKQVIRTALQQAGLTEIVAFKPHRKEAVPQKSLQPHSVWTKNDIPVPPGRYTVEQLAQLDTCSFPKNKRTFQAEQASVLTGYFPGRLNRATGEIETESAREAANEWLNRFQLDGHYEVMFDNQLKGYRVLSLRKEDAQAARAEYVYQRYGAVLYEDLELLKVPRLDMWVYRTSFGMRKHADLIDIERRTGKTITAVPLAYNEAILRDTMQRARTHLQGEVYRHLTGPLPHTKPVNTLILSHTPESHTLIKEDIRAVSVYLLKTYGASIYVGAVTKIYAPRENPRLAADIAALTPFFERLGIIRTHVLHVGERLIQSQPAPVLTAKELQAGPVGQLWENDAFREVYNDLKAVGMSDEAVATALNDDLALQEAIGFEKGTWFPLSASSLRTSKKRALDRKIITEEQIKKRQSVPNPFTHTDIRTMYFALCAEGCTDQQIADALNTSPLKKHLGIKLQFTKRYLAVLVHRAITVDKLFTREDIPVRTRSTSKIEPFQATAHEVSETPLHFEILPQSQEPGHFTIRLPLLDEASEPLVISLPNDMLHKIIPLLRHPHTDEEMQTPIGTNEPHVPTLEEKIMATEKHDSIHDFEHLYTICQGYLLTQALKLNNGNWHDAEDLTHDVWQLAMEQMPDVREGIQPGPDIEAQILKRQQKWLVRVLYLRHKWKGIREEEVTNSLVKKISPKSELNQPAEWIPGHDEIIRRVREFNPHYQLVFYLKHILNHETKEISDALEVSHQSIITIVTKLRAKLLQ